MAVKYLVPDGEHLPYTGEDGKPDHRLMGAAWAALHGGYRGNKYEGPDKDKAVAHLRSVYKSEGMTPPGEESKAGNASNTEEAIECRAAVDISPTTTNEILFLPIGLHAITPVAGGIGRPIKVKVDQSSASAIHQQLSALRASGKRAYFDFNHEDGPASFWPEDFIWRSGEGVIAKGEWTRRGKDAVEGRDFRAFSPVFHVDNKRSDPATVVCKDTADPNMGGLVNNPAFKDLPLWAKNAGQSSNAGATGDNNEGKEMTNEEIAALRAKQKELEDKVEALRAEAASDASAADKLTAGQIELRNIELEIQAEELRSKGALQDEIIRKRNKTDAEAAVKAAIQRGAVLPKDTKMQNELIARAIADPAFIAIIGSMQGSGKMLGNRITEVTRGQLSIIGEEPAAIYGEMAKLLSNSKRSFAHAEKAAISKEFAAIYSRELRGSNKERMLSFPIADFDLAIKAGDNVDADLGTLSGTLVTQRVLELLKFMFPSLTSFTTDFSDQPAQFNQTIMTRTVEVPDVQTYNTSTGWTDSDADTADVPVTINQHKGVPITFNANILASTVRRLFEEFAPAQAYALAKDMVDNLYTNITDANFPNNTVVGTTAFNRSSVIDVGIAQDLLGVPAGLGMRHLLLYPTVFGNLEKDSVFVSPLLYTKPELISEPTPGGVSLAIKVENYEVIKAPNLPTNNGNVTGFAGSKSALCIATRVPNDYTSVLPGASFGNVQMVTDPDIGITVMLVQYVNHQLGTATSRIALMYGTAPGQGNAGYLIKAHAGSGSSRVS
jgi:phage I-like protein